MPRWDQRSGLGKFVDPLASRRSMRRLAPLVGYSPGRPLLSRYLNPICCKSHAVHNFADTIMIWLGCEARSRPRAQLGSCRRKCARGCMERGGLHVDGPSMSANVILG